VNCCKKRNSCWISWECDEGKVLAPSRDVTKAGRGLDVRLLRLQPIGSAGLRFNYGLFHIDLLQIVGLNANTQLSVCH